MIRLHSWVSYTYKDMERDGLLRVGDWVTAIVVEIVLEGGMVEVLEGCLFP